MDPRMRFALLAARAHTLLTPVEPLVNQHPQILFCRAAFQPFLSQFSLMSGITLSQMENLAFGCVQFHAIDDCSVLQSIQIPLQGLLSTSQFHLQTY